MTISAETYEEINNQIIAILEKYQQELTQYDMLRIVVNLTVSYIDVVVKHDDVKREQITNEIIRLIQTTIPEDFMSSSSSKE